MQKIDFNKDWICRCLTRDEEAYPRTVNVRLELAYVLECAEVSLHASHQLIHLFQCSPVGK